MGKPDVASSECIAQVAQDSDLPEAVPIVFIQVPMPFCGAAQKVQRAVAGGFRSRDDRGPIGRFLRRTTLRRNI